MPLILRMYKITKTNAVADPGYPVGGHGPVGGGHGPPTRALFSKNVWENKRIGSHGGGGMCLARPP